MSKRLPITALDLQNGTRTRDAVARAIVEALKECQFEVGPKLDQAVDLIHTDLREFLKTMEIPDAEQEAAMIMSDVFQAIRRTLPEKRAKPRQVRAGRASDASQMDTNL